MSKQNIEVGTKVCVYGYRPVVVSRVFREDGAGRETDFECLTARVRMELDWGDGQKSFVSLHEEGKVWYRYSTAN